MHSSHERRLQALEGRLREQVHLTSEQAQELILEHLTDSEIDTLQAWAEHGGKPQTEAEAATLQRWGELQRALPEVQGLAWAHTVGTWALDMVKAWARV